MNRLAVLTTLALLLTVAPQTLAAEKPLVLDVWPGKARFLKVTLNDRVIHENVEVKGPTPSALTGKEAPTGPLLFQGDHGPVAFRNIKITPRTAK